MNITNNELQILQTILNLNKIGYPCTSDLRHKAQSLVDRGIIECDGSSELVVSNNTKWKLLEAGLLK